MFRRDVNNYADDSQVLSTGISFPIAFRKAILYGAEGKLEVQQWGPLFRLCQLLLHRGECFLPGHRRPFSW